MVTTILVLHHFFLRTQTLNRCACSNSSIRSWPLVDSIRILGNSDLRIIQVDLHQKSKINNKSHSNTKLRLNHQTLNTSFTILKNDALIIYQLWIYVTISIFMSGCTCNEVLFLNINIAIRSQGKIKSKIVQSRLLIEDIR